MKPEAIREFVLTILDNMKATDIISLDVRELTSITDYMIICTGSSTTHVKALAKNIAEKAKLKKVKTCHIEGEQDSEWVLVDLGDLVVHIMLGHVRSFYRLEDLWESTQSFRTMESYHSK
jgi:ribosome-associated protein